MTITFGANNINELNLGQRHINRVFLGNDLVWGSSPYEIGQTIYENNVGGKIESLRILVTGKYRVILSAGGGGSSSLGYWSGKTSRKGCAATGGSSGYIDAVFEIENGQYLVSTSVKGNSSKKTNKNYANQTTASKTIDQSPSTNQNKYTRIYWQEGAILADSIVYCVCGDGARINNATPYFGQSGNKGYGRNITPIQVNVNVSGTYGDTTTNQATVVDGASSYDGIHGFSGSAKSGQGEQSVGYANASGPGFIRIIYEGN